MRYSRVFAASAASLVMCGILWPAADAYPAQIDEWRRQREAALKADGGWLTVTGLFWLNEGENRFDAALKDGVFDLHDGKVTLRMGGQTRELRPDSAGKPDVATMGSLSMRRRGPTASPSSLHCATRRSRARSTGPTCST